MIRKAFYRIGKGLLPCEILSEQPDKRTAHVRIKIQPRPNVDATDAMWIVKRNRLVFA